MVHPFSASVALITFTWSLLVFVYLFDSLQCLSCGEVKWCMPFDTNVGFVPKHWCLSMCAHHNIIFFVYPDISKWIAFALSQLKQPTLLRCIESKVANCQIPKNIRLKYIFEWLHKNKKCFKCDRRKLLHSSSGWKIQPIKPLNVNHNIHNLLSSFR